MRENDIPSQGSDIPPSSIGEEDSFLRGELERRLSRANFSPLDPQREGPSESDMYLSNALIQTLETRFAAFLSRSQKKGLSGPAIFGIGLTGGAIGGVIGAGAVIYVPRAFGAEHENINSFPNYFNNPEGPQLEIQSSQVELPPVIDPKNPDKINLLFPIELAPGSENRELKIERDVDPMGFGVRSIARVDPSKTDTTPDMVISKLKVMSRFRIVDGLKEGDVLRSPVSGAIESGNTKQNENGIVKPGGFYLKGKDEKGNFFTIIIRTVDLKPTKDIPPARHENLGDGQWKLITTPVPIEADEEIGIIMTSERDPHPNVNAQIQIVAYSTVIDEDGLKHLGPADIVMHDLPPNIISSKK